MLLSVSVIMVLMTPLPFPTVWCKTVETWRYLANTVLYIIIDNYTEHLGDKIAVFNQFVSLYVINTTQWHEVRGTWKSLGKFCNHQGHLWHLKISEKHFIMRLWWNDFNLTKIGIQLPPHISSREWRSKWCLLSSWWWHDSTTVVTILIVIYW